MPAILQLIQLLLPWILRAFGLAAAGFLSWKGVDNLAALQSAGVSASPGDIQFYVYGPQAGGIATLVGSFSWASWINQARARKAAIETATTASLTDWFSFIGKALAMLTEYPPLMSLIEDLIKLLGASGLSAVSQHLSAAVKAARAGK